MADYVEAVCLDTLTVFGHHFCGGNMVGIVGYCSCNIVEYCGDMVGIVLAIL